MCAWALANQGLFNTVLLSLQRTGPRSLAVRIIRTQPSADPHLRRPRRPHCGPIEAGQRQGVPELKIEHASAWYGPTTLTLELASDASMAASREHLDRSRVPA